MHPQLSDKNIVCQEFIKALEQCHESNWARLTGLCNDHKDRLNSCLRKERVERMVRNREDAKERNEKRQKAMDALRADD